MENFIICLNRLRFYGADHAAFPNSSDKDQREQSLGVKITWTVENVTSLIVKRSH